MTRPDAAAVWIPATVLACLTIGAAAVGDVVRGGRPSHIGTSTSAPPREIEPQPPKPPQPRPAAGLYDADPHHVWNRVHRHLHVRVAPDGAEHGDDEVDPLLWRETAFLLTGPSHTAAIGVLDEFLKADAERLISDPLKRAVFQHDLWAVFDWAVAPADTLRGARHALATRLARIIRRVALTRPQIETLPDNYQAAVKSGIFPSRPDPLQRTRAFLPADVFADDGPWLNIRDSFVDPIATEHAGTFSHSAFEVLFRLPDASAAAALKYLETLWAFPEPYIGEAFHDDGQRTALNPKLPWFPAGSQVALIRTMLLIDDTGAIVQAPVTESVQVRAFHAPPGRPEQQWFPSDQDFVEFRTLRRKLFAGEAGGFHAIAPDEQRFMTFSVGGHDRLARADVLKGCQSCHHGVNIHSIRIARRLLKPQERLDFRHDRWRTYARPAPFAKARRYDWGVLQTLWQSNPR
jgi:hypothetical protein